MVLLHTERLILREFTPAEALVAHMIAWMRDEPRQYVGLAITVGTDDRLVGRCGLERTGREPGEAMLSYSLYPDYWGCGLMTEAVWALVGFGFAEMGLHRI